MKLKTGVTFHNRFDIEVRDKDTNELKYQGQAENIILDRMYTRLCNFNSYFTNIVFGSGTGDLSPSRTTLFNRVGYKSATTEEIIKGFPVSKWTRSITLMPEEYVGVELTEVGISDTTTNINTHALIKDAEGNPLSIVKTDIDVVIIYATVFIELQDNGESIYWYNLPNNNQILNYLTGGSAPSSTVAVGKKWTKGDIISSNIIQSKTGSRTADTTNKKVVLNTLRFGIDEGNGPIAEIEIFNSFKTTLPNTAVFPGYTFKDINIGVGDGNTRRFMLPHIRAENIVVRVDNVINNDIAIQNYNNVNFKMQNLIGVGAYGRGVSISPDGNTLVTASEGSPYFTVQRLNADTGEYEKMQELTGVGAYGCGVSISPDGNTIVTASEGSPYFTVQRLNTDTGEYEKVQELTGAGSDGRGVSISPDGNTIATASYNSSPYFTVQRLNTDTGEYEKMQELTGVGSKGYGVTISPDGNTIATASYGSPYFTVHRLNADRGEYEKMQELIGVGSYGWRVTISPDGNTIATASYGSPYFTVHRLNADTGEYEKMQELTGVGSKGYGVTISPDGNTIATASYGSPYFTVHNFEKTFKTIIFTTPPPEGAVITADYSVPYIPKSEDYVLDVSAEIQFGEGTII